MEINHTPDTLFNNCFIPGPIYLSRHARYNRKDIIFFCTSLWLRRPLELIAGTIITALLAVAREFDQTLEKFYETFQFNKKVEKRRKSVRENSFFNGDLYT